MTPLYSEELLHAVLSLQEVNFSSPCNSQLYVSHSTVDLEVLKMSLRSDITLDASKFDPANIPEKTAQLNEAIIDMMKDGPKWYEVGAEEYRRMRWNNETPVPRPPLLDSGIDIRIPSRDNEREIPIRMFKPPVATKGVFLHFHGGGWVLQTEHYQDTYLKFIADAMDLTVLSVGYRLAPEHPFPAGPDDCVDAAEHVLREGNSKYGGNLLFIGGESAGAQLTMITMFDLLRRYDDPLPIKGLVLHYGAFELSQCLPMVYHFDKQLILEKFIMWKYIEAFLPGMTVEQRRDPKISPFWENLMGERFFKRLPSALFTCGTEDPLLDDTTMMSVKWMVAAGEAVVKIYPGAPHGFTLFPRDQSEAGGVALDDMKAFVHVRLMS